MLTGKKLFSKTLLTLAILAGSSSIIGFKSAKADELKDMLSKVEKLTNEGSYTKALSELKWVNTHIQKKHLSKLQSFFPEKIDELPGQKVDSGSMMGMINLSRRYNGSGRNIKASITGSTSGGGNPFGQFAKMAQMMGGANSNGKETVRIEGRTATLEQRESSGRGELTIFLKSGLMLKVEGKSLDNEKLKKIAKTFDLDGIEEYTAT